MSDAGKNRKQAAFRRQGILKTGSVEQREEVVNGLLSGGIRKFARDACGVFENHVVRASFRHGTEEQRSRLVDAVLALPLKNLVKNKFAIFVVRDAWTHASREQRRQMVKEVAALVERMAVRKEGRFDLSYFLWHCPDDDDDSYRTLADAIVSRADELVCHEHGHHVLRTILKLGRTDAAQGIVDSVTRNAHHLEDISMDKWGTHVVQTILSNGTRVQTDATISLILASKYILDWGDDAFCSHVVQSALANGTFAQREAIVARLERHVLEWGCHEFGPS